ncbi:hypothetical protein MRBLMI12_000965 [Microbacterium sp. LMI12-1-1.1]|uniref:hypothetical protein n=1 Tax=Microbacterium sp. LMI12-1-1.1 TaxID=3135225 RepID=UPI0034313605
MSTTGNEYEQTGVNYPDRGDAGGAQDTPAAGEPVRDEAPAAPPTMSEPADDAGNAPAANEAPAESRPEPAAAPAGEPSHEAVGIGVVDGSDHHGHDEGRDTLTASQAQQTPGGLGAEQEQRLPAMSQNNASDVDKVAGIVAQTRSDVGTEPLERIAEVLRQRLSQSGVDLPDNDIEELARQVSTGDADSPAAPGRDAVG